MDRRDFLKAGAASAAALVAGPAAAAPGAVACRTLGRTGLKLNVVGIGALLISEAAVFRAAFDMGVNYVDTARCYMGGRNEAIVGEALKGYRDKVLVATKLFPNAPKTMREDIDKSLSALGVDYVDVLHLHRLDAAAQVTNEEYRTVMAEAKQQGKTRFLAVSTHSNEVEVINAMVDDPDRLYDAVLVVYNFKSRPQVDEAIARAAKAGLGVVAMKTQAGGYETSELGDVSPHQAALKWVLQNEHVTAAVPSMVNLAQLKENLAVMGMPLTRTDVAVLERYGEAIEPYYCHRCGACGETCRRNVDIPAINRSLMYAEGYGRLELARATYRELPAEASAKACLDCAECTARCVHGIDVAERVRRARALLS